MAASGSVLALNDSAKEKVALLRTDLDLLMEGVAELVPLQVRAAYEGEEIAAVIIDLVEFNGLLFGLRQFRERLLEVLK